MRPPLPPEAGEGPGVRVDSPDGGDVPAEARHPHPRPLSHVVGEGGTRVPPAYPRILVPCGSNSGASSGTADRRSPMISTSKPCFAPATRAGT